MKLDDKSAQGIINHIKSKWGEKGQCPKCYKSASYSFKGADVRVFMLTEYHRGTVVFGGDSAQVPLVPIFCDNCGYIELLNVKIIDKGLLEKPTPEEKL